MSAAWIPPAVVAVLPIYGRIAKLLVMLVLAIALTLLIMDDVMQRKRLEAALQVQPLEVEQRERRSPRSAPLRNRHNHSVVASRLLTTLQVATLDKYGAVVMPKDTAYVFIEIGCSDRDTLDEQVLPHHKKAFLLSFEPMLDKYAVLASRGTKRYHSAALDQAVPLGHHHSRGVVLPLAVSPTAGPVPLHVSRISGCSSLRAQQNTSRQWVTFCNQPMEDRLVEAITLSDALALAGARPIRLIKVDAQGIDFQLVNATRRAALARVQSIHLEMWRDTPTCAGRSLYGSDVTTCRQALARMAQLGFRYVGHTRDGVALPELMRLGPQQALIRPTSAAPDVCGASADFPETKCEWNALFVNEHGAYPTLRDSELVVLPENRRRR